MNNVDWRIKLDNLSKKVRFNFIKFVEKSLIRNMEKISVNLLNSFVYGTKSLTFGVLFIEKIINKKRR